MDSKRFLTLKDIQDILVISRAKATALVNTEGFPVIKLGRTYRINADEFEKWLNEHKGKEIIL